MKLKLTQHTACWQLLQVVGAVMVAKSLSWGGQLSNMVHMPLELAGQQKQKLTIQFNVKVITRYCSPPWCGRSSGFSCIRLIHCLTSCFLKRGIVSSNQRALHFGGFEMRRTVHWLFGSSPSFRLANFQR